MRFRETIANIFRRNPKASQQQIIQQAEKAGVPPSVAVAEVKKEGVLLRANVNAQKQVLQQEVEVLKKAGKEADTDFKAVREAKEKIELAHTALHRAQKLVYELERIIYSRNESMRKLAPLATSSKWVQGREMHLYSENIKSIYSKIIRVTAKMMELEMTVKKEELISENMKNSILSNTHEFNALIKDYLYNGDKSSVYEGDIKNMERKMDSFLKQYAPINYDWIKMAVSTMHSLQLELDKLVSDCARLKSSHIDFDEKDAQVGPLATPKFRDNINKIADQIIVLINKSDKDFKAGIGLLLRVEEIDKQILQQEQMFHGDMMRSARNFLNFDKIYRGELEKEFVHV